MSLRIAFDDLDALSERCAATSVHLTADEPGYDARALLPVPDWQPLTSRLIKEFGGGPVSDGALVEIVRLGGNVPGGGASDDEISGYDPFAGQQPSSFLGFVDNPAGQLTTTVDTGTGSRLGIHLDNFDKLPTDRRTESRRRLAVNLGPGPRYIVLATTDIQEISRAMQASPRHPHTNDVRRYVRDGGSLECVRVRLDPGEGYIAPTELLPHDGSTWGMDTPSRIAFWLGHWPAGILRSLL